MSPFQFPLAKIGQPKLSDLGQFLPDVWKAKDSPHVE
jgi:hypothetical protein